MFRGEASHRGGRGRGRGKRSNNRRNQRNNRSRGPPPTPVLKVTLRNLPDLGAMGASIQELLNAANEKLATKLFLDESKMQQVVEKEKIAIAADTKWKSEQTPSQEEREEEERPDDGKDQIARSGISASKDMDQIASDIQTKLQITDTKPRKNQIDVRPLYLVPPKATRRRGNRTGIAYLILTAPEMNVLPDVPDAVAFNNHILVADYSRIVAKARLQLDQALEAMQAVTEAQRKTDTAAIIVEESANSKIWKDLSKSVESGSIFQTPEYQEFLETSTNLQEQIKARPKPAPGGGVAITNHEQQPVAALVEYLQGKLEEERQRKQAKRKEKKQTEDAKKRGRRPRKKRPPTNGKKPANG